MSYEIKARAGNGILFVEFEGLDGKRKRVSLGTRDEAAAKTKARDVFLAHLTGRDPAAEPEAAAEAKPKRKAVMTLNMAFDKMMRAEWSPARCKSWKKIASDCKIIGDIIGDIEVADLTYEDFLKFETTCRERGHVVGTIKRRLGRVKVVMRHCAETWRNPDTKRPYVDRVPSFPKVGKPNVRRRELSEEDERRVLDYCDERAGNSIRGQQWWLFKQFIIWQIDTGMRKSESLLVDEARIVNNRVRLYEGETKNEDAREIPLTSRLVKLVETFKAMGLNGPFFGSLSHSKIFEMWNEARAKLNLGDVTIHDLRHTRGQRLYDAGVPLEVISELLGHRDISVTAQVYTKRKAATLDKWTRHAEENPGAALRLVS